MLKRCRGFFCRRCKRQVAGCVDPTHTPAIDWLDSCAICAQKSAKRPERED